VFGQHVQKEKGQKRNRRRKYGQGRKVQHREDDGEIIRVPDIWIPRVKTMEKARGHRGGREKTENGKGT